MRESDIAVGAQKKERKREQALKAGGVDELHPEYVLEELP